jgi:hypothetical protein
LGGGRKAIIVWVIIIKSIGHNSHGRCCPSLNSWDLFLINFLVHPQGSKVLLFLVEQLTVGKKVFATWNINKTNKPSRRMELKNTLSLSCE